MILGLYQCPSPRGDLAAGLARVSDALTQAAQAHVDMLTMPEAFLPGYGSTPRSPPDGWNRVVPQLSALCVQHGVALTIGLPEYDGAFVYNSTLTISASGEILARYRKIQLFGPAEAALFAPGDRYVTFNYLGTCFGLLICYDVEFPEHTRALARAGADVILVPTANMTPFVNVNQIIVPARAAESALTIVYANYCGSEGDLEYVGLSAIQGPDGYLLGGKGTQEGLCIAELPEGWNEHGIPLSTQLIDLKDAK